jgi:IclR family transcriptional regulator, acetate operon repressor
MVANPHHPSSASQGRTAERVVAVVETLVDETGGLHLSEVARRCDLPKTTVYRVLSELVSFGIVTRQGERYMPGWRLLAWAAGTSSRSALVRRSLVMPSLLWLREATGLAAAFSVLRYGSVCFESVVYPSGRVDSTATAPGWAPTYCTASGKAMLAHSVLVERPVVEGWKPINHIPGPMVNLIHLESDLRRIREQGMAYSNGEYLSDVYSAAVPVVDTRVSFVGAVAVCGTGTEISSPTVGHALRRAGWNTTVALRRQADLASNQ